MTKEPPHPRAISLISVIDTLRPGLWWLWECEVEDAAGNIRHGSIQSDGHAHAMETLEYEE